MRFNLTLLVPYVLAALIVAGCGGEFPRDTDEPQADASEEPEQPNEQLAQEDDSADFEDDADASVPGEQAATDEDNEQGQQPDAAQEVDEATENQEEQPAAVQGFAEHVSSPTVALMPMPDNGEWPRSLGRDEMTVSAVFNRMLMRPPYNLRMQEYESHLRSLQPSHGDAELEATPELRVGADIYLGFRVEVERSDDGVRASVALTALLVPTRELVFEKSMTSSVAVPSNQRDAEVFEVASVLAEEALPAIVTAYNRAYARGIPYRVRIGNVQSNEARAAVRSVARELSTDGRVLQWEQVESEVRFLIYADAQEMTESIIFMMQVRTSLDEAGLPHRPGSARAHGNNIALDLQ